VHDTHGRNVLNSRESSVVNIAVYKISVVNHINLSTTVRAFVSLRIYGCGGTHS
jgi:hypothetical protein